MPAATSEMPSLLAMYTRVVLESLPPVRRWRRTGTWSTDDLPARSVCAQRVGIPADRLAEYRQACGFAAETEVPATYLHVLAFPLHLKLMTAPGFPLPVLGAVHIADTIVQERPLSTSESLDLSVHATGLLPHRRGRQITLVTEASSADQIVWREESVFLHRDGAAAKGVHSGADGSAGEQHPPAWQAASGGELIGPSTWKVPGGVGRRYAAVSGDRNPIHLFDVTAKPFGFSRHIAHGMWTTARVLAQLSDRLPRQFRCDVAFGRPLSLPADVRFQAADTAERIGFSVTPATSPPTPHLTGSITRL